MLKIARNSIISGVFFLVISSNAATPEISFSDPATHNLLEPMYNEAVSCLLANSSEGRINAGGDYGTPWTRDGSYNSWFGGSLLIPDIAENTLWLIAQQGGTVQGQWWDKIIWVTAAWHHYKVTGDATFLSDAYTVTKNTLNDMRSNHFNSSYGLFKGPAFFQDGIAGYPSPPYDPSNSSSSVTSHPGTDELLVLSTNCLYFNAYICGALMAEELGKDPSEIDDLKSKASVLKGKINEHLWMPDSGKYGYFIHGTGSNQDELEPYQEGGGHGFALIFGVAEGSNVTSILENVHIHPHGIVAVYPHFERFSDAQPGRHNLLVWPHINGLWARGALLHGGIETWRFEVENLAGLVRNSSNNIREIYNATSGEPDGGWQVGSHWSATRDQTWGATAFLSWMYDGLFGMNFETDGIRFSPTLPSSWGNGASLSGLEYRNMTLNIQMTGTGQSISSFKIDDVVQSEAFVSSTLTGDHTVTIALEQTAVKENAATQKHPFFDLYVSGTVLYYRIVSDEVSQVKISLYNVKGELITTCANKSKPGGYYTLDLHKATKGATQLSAGIYLCRMEACGFSKAVRVFFK